MTSEDFFGEIRDHLNDELPFVVYRKPNEMQLKSLLQKDSTVYNIVDFTESGFVFAPFDDKEQAVIIPIQSARFLKLNSFTLSDSETSEGPLSNPLSSSEEEKHFHIKLVQKSIDAIKLDKFQKVVVSRKEEISMSDKNPIEIFKKLLNKYESAFVYCWYHPKIGLWLGATPETLLKIEGLRLSTMSLAGTQKFNGALDVSWQPKEREEQQIVTDFIVKSLSSSSGRESSVGSVQSGVNEVHVSETETIQAGNLLHLKTDISVNFKPETLNLKQILQNLHPTPAICGFPKEKSKHFILQNEDYNREYYSGFLGELNFKEKNSRNSNRRNVENNAYTTVKTISNLYVNLRCMQLQNDRAIIYMGGGITKDSNPEMEWDETVSKSEVIKSVLSL